MKFALSSVALICAVSAADRTAVSTSADCSDATKTCPTTDCCGTAKPVSGTQTKQVCADRSATTWTDVN